MKSKHVEKPNLAKLLKISASTKGVKLLQKRKSPQPIKQIVILDGKTHIEESRDQYSSLNVHPQAQIVCEGANYISKSVQFTMSEGAKLHLINCHLTNIHIHIEENGTLQLKRLRCVQSFDASPAQKQKDLIKVPSSHTTRLDQIRLESNRNKVIGALDLVGTPTRIMHADARTKIESMQRFSHLILRDCYIEGPISITGKYILKGLRYKHSDIDNPVHLVHDIRNGEDALVTAGKKDTLDILDTIPVHQEPKATQAPSPIKPKVTYIPEDEHEVRRITGSLNRYREIDEEHRQVISELNGHDKTSYILANLDWGRTEEEEEEWYAYKDAEEKRELEANKPKSPSDALDFDSLFLD